VCVYKVVSSATIMVSFCGVILQMFISIIFRAFHNVSELQMSGMGGEANIAVFVETSQRVNAWLSPHGCWGYRMWWDVRIQLQGMRLEFYISNMGFWLEVYKVLGSSTTTTSFCNVVLLRFLSVPFEDNKMK